jgi:hypothetical protein
MAIGTARTLRRLETLFDSDARSVAVVDPQRSAS